MINDPVLFDSRVELFGKLLFYEIEAVPVFLYNEEAVEAICRKYDITDDVLFYRAIRQLTLAGYIRPAGDGWEIARQRAGNTPKIEDSPAPSVTHRVKSKVDYTGEKNLIERFEKFWAAYPKKVAKKVAFASFKRLNPDDKLLGAILEDIARRKGSNEWTKDEGRFILHPSTYLNQERWSDVTFNQKELENDYDDDRPPRPTPPDFIGLTHQEAYAAAEKFDRDLAEWEAKYGEG